MQKRIFRSKSTIYHLSTTNSGFSLVELIIVIAIIAIIATLGLASYNAEIQNSIQSSLQSGLKNASKQLVVDQIRSSTGIYPATLAAANSGTGISFSPGTTVVYNVDNTDTPKTFCLSATQRGQSYFIIQEGTPLPGPCPVLYLDAGIQTSYPGTGTAWGDLSGLGNNGIMYNTTYSGANLGSMVFNGSSSYVNVADNNSLDFGTGSFTIEAWIKFGAYGGDYRTMISKGASGGFSGWRFGVSTAGVPHVLIGDASGYVDSDLGTTPVGLNAWHYLVIVYNRTSNAIGYIDGASVGSASISAKNGSVSNASAVGIGNSYTWYNGQIGIVSIRSGALSDTDISNTWKAIKGRYGL